MKILFDIVKAEYLSKQVRQRERGNESDGDKHRHRKKETDSETGIERFRDWHR